MYFGSATVCFLIGLMFGTSVEFYRINVYKNFKQGGWYGVSNLHVSRIINRAGGRPAPDHLGGEGIAAA